MLIRAKKLPKRIGPQFYIKLLPERLDFVFALAEHATETAKQKRRFWM